MKTTSNNLEPLAQSVLLAAYELSSEDRLAHVGSLAERLGCSRAEVEQALSQLEARGLVWAARCRLSMSGLALAVQLWSQRARARRCTAA